MNNDLPAGLPICIVPSFHYDVAYLKPYAGYLPDCFAILDEALRLLERHREYRFLIEQVILLDEYWQRFPEQRVKLRRFADEGRLEVGPGMWVMPDMNHPAGETLYLQAKLGKDWLRQHLGLDPKVCWIADCWGHHAQLPQILRDCGYEYYVFWRCMRRDVMQGDFVWRGLDGTTIKTHWLARGYGNVRFPAQTEVVHALEMDLTGCGPDDIRRLCETLGQYGPARMLCNGGDMAMPQATGPAVVERLRQEKDMAGLQFATPTECLSAVDWATTPTVDGEFNSAFQGTFTANIRIKQANRTLTNQMLALDALAVALGQKADFSALWRVVLKQQFHDIICGTITDEALRECLEEYAEAAAGVREAVAKLSVPVGVEAVFNPLSWPVERTIEQGGRRMRVSVPAVGFAAVGEGRELTSRSGMSLPGRFENAWYRAEIAASGYLTSLVEKSSGRELVRTHAAPFGALTMQMDYGDLWLNFVGPLSGGSLESALVQDDPDPFDRMPAGSIVNSGTFVARLTRAAVVAGGDDELIVEQEGVLSFWRLQVPFRTRVILSSHTPRIEYETKLLPQGKHYRIRAAFPVAIEGGTARHEIPYGFQKRGAGEHVAQHWMDCADAQAGLAVLNAGTPGSNVSGGVMLLTLLRAAAMEYKAPSEAAFGEGIEHVFRYAVVPHAGEDLATVVRNGHEFNAAVLTCRVPRERLGASGWAVDGAVLSALRWSGERVLMRCYEPVGKAGAATIRVPGAGARWARCDGLERTGAFAPVEEGITLAMRPFGVVGVLVEPSP